jgi:hypothetical protein
MRRVRVLRFSTSKAFESVLKDVASVQQQAPDMTRQAIVSALLQEVQAEEKNFHPMRRKFASFTPAAVLAGFYWKYGIPETFDPITVGLTPLFIGWGITALLLPMYSWSECEDERLRIARRLAILESMQDEKKHN